MFYRKYDDDPSDVEAAIQRMYDDEHDEEQAEKFAKIGFVGKTVYSLLNPYYDFDGDSKIEKLLDEFESWDFLNLGKFK